MSSRILLICCTIAVLLFLGSSAVLGEQRHIPRLRKVSNPVWLAAPHFQALTKRGRFVFRNAANEHLHDSASDDFDLHPDKRNWRL